PRTPDADDPADPYLLLDQEFPGPAGRPAAGAVPGGRFAADDDLGDAYLFFEEESTGPSGRPAAGAVPGGESAVPDAGEEPPPAGRH
ncbi:hypothetical protein AB8O53_34780, partial [Streptomyces pilosus]